MPYSLLDVLLGVVVNSVVIGDRLPPLISCLSPEAIEYKLKFQLPKYGKKLLYQGCLGTSSYWSFL